MKTEGHILTDEQLEEYQDLKEHVREQFFIRHINVDVNIDWLDAIRFRITTVLDTKSVEEVNLEQIYNEINERMLRSLNAVSKERDGIVKLKEELISASSLWAFIKTRKLIKKLL